MATKKTKRKIHHPKPRKPARRTSDRVSRLAAKWLATMKGLDAGYVFVPARELKALCGSALSQDEHAGRRGRK